MRIIELIELSWRNLDVPNGTTKEETEVFKMKTKEIVDYLIKTNDPKFQIYKACEELSELSTELLQYANKDGRKTVTQDIIDEIGDVKLRLKILEKIFGKEKVKKRIKFKIKKFSKYIEEEKYIKQI